MLWRRLKQGLRFKSLDADPAEMQAASHELCQRHLAKPVPRSQRHGRWTLLARSKGASSQSLCLAHPRPVVGALLLACFCRRLPPGVSLETVRRLRGRKAEGNLVSQAVEESDKELRGLLPSKCERCNRKLCLCSALPQSRLETATQVVLCTHPKEKRRALGSGPLLQLCLRNILEVVCKEFPDPLDDPQLHQELRRGGRQPVLVYPGPDAHELAPGFQVPELDTTIRPRLQAAFCFASQERQSLEV